MEPSGPEHEPGFAGAEGAETLAAHSMIGEFEIIGIIGEGGFGTVYMAIDHSLQRRVALKEYRPARLATRQGKSVMVRSRRHLDEYEAGLTGFMNEARTLARFDHPALIQVYRVWQQNNTAYMAMALCEGRSLTSVVQETPELITEPWLRAMLAPLLDAVQTLHNVQIYHRDIAPDNVLIQSNGAPMLLDFGAARHIATGMTQALTVILKPGYAPIEQFADDPSMKQGPWTDIYALGAMMYFAVTGKAPPNSVARLANDPMKPLMSTSTRGFSPEFLGAIDAALAVRPDHRPQSIAELRALLDTPAPASAVTTATQAGPAPAPAKPVTTIKKASPRPVSRIKLGKGGADPVPQTTVRKAGTKQASKRVSSGTEPDQALVAGSGSTRAAGADFPPPEPIAAISATASPSTTGFDTPQAIPEAAPVTAQSAPAGARSHWKLQVAAAAIALALLGILATFAPNPFQPAPATVSAPDAANSGTATPVAGSPPTPAATDARAAGPISDTPATVPVAAAPPPVVAPATGTIRFAVQPWGEIIVDGVNKGASPPLKRFNVPEGAHRVEVTNPGFPSYSTEIQVPKNQSVTVSYQFK